MPIVQQLKKIQFCYTSPDGDEYEITFIETKERKYVEIVKVLPDSSKLEPVKYDFDMLSDLVINLRQITGQATTYSVYASNSGHNLKAPTIVDHRPEEVGNSVQQTVSDSMKNYNDNEEPLHCFSRSESEANAGISIEEATNPVKETPEHLRNNFSADYNRIQGRQVSNVGKKIQRL